MFKYTYFNEIFLKVNQLLTVGFKFSARNIAYKVKKTRRPVSLEPMNPYERRVIHSALQNDPLVSTHSEGEEPYRKVVVTLKKQ